MLISLIAFQSWRLWSRKSSVDYGEQNNDDDDDDDDDDGDDDDNDNGDDDNDKMGWDRL